MNNRTNFVFVLAMLLCGAACKKKTVTQAAPVESRMTKERVSGVLSDDAVMWDADDVK